MPQPVRIPIRVKRGEEPPEEEQPEQMSLANTTAANETEPAERTRTAAGVESQATAISKDPGEAEAWRERALRLQADMENFRKRQRRLAEEQIAEERDRLLSQFATIADDLERALQARDAGPTGLREGVALTYQAMMRLMEREGVETIRPEGNAFDPHWHEAVSTVPHVRAGVPPNTVVQVVRNGYRLAKPGEDRLIRPARVIVAI
jgi:molecular chaperone GrpE